LNKNDNFDIERELSSLKIIDWFDLILYVLSDSLPKIEKIPNHNKINIDYVQIFFSTLLKEFESEDWKMWEEWKKSQHDLNYEISDQDSLVNDLAK